MRRLSLDNGINKGRRLIKPSHPSVSGWSERESSVFAQQRAAEYKKGRRE
jgi:hypothetical protein